MPDPEQQERFKRAVERKSAEAEAAATATSVKDHAAQPDQQRHEPGDVDPRTKNSRHGQVTADKWNQ